VAITDPVRIHELVQALVNEAGLPASESEVDRLVAAYTEQRHISEMLFAVQEARYESPALSFTATPVFADWWSDD
jgi:hypothetical protein